MADEWWRGAVIYQIYPRSFRDSDGDGVGDLAGITSRLEHVADLGADAIWLSPVFVSPMDDMGYDVADHTDIDPLFGTLADFDALIDRAHGLGLRVIIDQVLSHTSSKHAWFVDSRASREGERSDWYVWSDPRPDGTPPNNWGSNFGGPAWEWEPRRQQYYLHHFLPSQPDLNLHCPAAREAVLDTVRFWLERGVDGLRLDAIDYCFHDPELRDNPPEPLARDERHLNPMDLQRPLYSRARPENIDFLRRLRTLSEAYEARLLIGEIGQGRRSIETMAEYTLGGDRLHMAYSFELLGERFTAAHLRSAIESFFAAAPDGWPSWSFSNHDVARHVGRWAEHATDGDAFAYLAIALLASLEGSIGLYQGEELGLSDTEIAFEELTDPAAIRYWPDWKGRDGCRTPMVWDDSPGAGFTTGTPWLPIKSPQRDRNVAAQRGRARSTLERYRRVLRFRRSRPALRRGRTRFLDTPEPLLAFERELDGERLLCAFNLSTSTVALTLDAVPGGDRLVGPSAEAELAGKTLTLGPNGFAWLESAR